MGFQLLGDILDEGKDDRITELPDGILSSVISSLTARDAAKTSILSRRWICLYASLPTLNFDCCTMFAIPKDRCREHSHKFVNAVDKTLHLHLSPTVISLRISFGFEVGFGSNIDRWISFAVRMGVGKLGLNLLGFDPDINHVKKYRYNELYIFPFKLLLSETSKINYLHLHSCILGLDLNARVSSLTALDLDSVVLDQRDVRCIFSSCVNLEWLRLRRCRLPNDLFIRGPSLPLKFVMVDHCVGVKEIVLGAANLIAFELYDLSITNFCIGNVPKLERVALSVQCSSSPTCILDKLERDLPQLTSLSILTSATVMQWMPRNMAPLRNVRHLDFFINLDARCDLLNIIPVLSACPLVQKFHLVMSCAVENGETETESPTADSSHHHMHLKEIEMGGFDGTPKQMAFAKRLLENAHVLELVVIDPHYKFFMGDAKWVRGGNSWDSEKRQLVREELLCSKTVAQVIIR